MNEERKLSMDQVGYVIDRSRSGLMERCRQRALGMMEQVGPYEVWQHLGKDRGYRLVGTLPGVPHQSNSGIFQIRPGDFSWGEVDGKRVILAAWNIGPGDFACVPGFTNADGTVPEMDEHARQFDQLTGFGADRVTALSTIIADALGRPK